MRKFFLSSILAIGAAGSAFSCDICGCSGSGLQQGIMPGILHDFIGARYSHRIFESTHPGLFGKPGSVSNENFGTAELWGRYSPIPRIQLMAFVPYNYFVKTEQNLVPETVSGLGDVRFLANGVVIQRQDTSGHRSHLWTVGGGVKLPTGAVNYSPTGEGVYNPNMQAGTGSLDYVISTSYAARWNKFGFLTDLSYTVNGVNKANYRFGNRAAATARVFARLSPENKAHAWVPQAGYSFEHADRDFRDFSAGQTNAYSGGQFGFALLAVDFFTGRFGINVNAALPVHQNFAMGRVSSKGRFGAGLIFLFNSF